MINGPSMTVWTIYDSPSDYPGKWVVRAHDIPGGARLDAIVCGSLEEARSEIPSGLTRLPRHISDEPQIHEVWL